MNETSKDLQTVKAALRKWTKWQHCAGAKIVGIMLLIEDS